MADKPNTRERFKGELTLSAVTDAPPVKKGGADLTQFVGILSESNDKRTANANATANGEPAPFPLTAKQAVIPAGAVTLTETRFRQAAAELGIGVSIKTVDSGTAEGNRHNLTAGQALIIVEAREKRASGGRPKKQATSAGNPSSTSAPASGAAKRGGK